MQLAESSYEKSQKAVQVNDQDVLNVLQEKKKGGDLADTSQPHGDQQSQRDSVQPELQVVQATRLDIRKRLSETTTQLDAAKLALDKAKPMLQPSKDRYTVSEASFRNKFGVAGLVFGAQSDWSSERFEPVSTAEKADRQDIDCKIMLEYIRSSGGQSDSNTQTRFRIATQTMARITERFAAGSRLEAQNQKRIESLEARQPVADDGETLRLRLLNYANRDPSRSQERQEAIAAGNEVAHGGRALVDAIIIRKYGKPWQKVCAR